MAKSIAKLHLKGRERLSLYSDLATMLTAGIPLLDAVEALETDARGSMHDVLRVLHVSLTNGQPLSSALERLPNSFSAIDINLIRAAEAGGTLEETLHDIVTTTKKEIAFSEQLRTTMIYPIFVMVIFLAIVVLMLTFVIPRISSVFLTMHVHIPFMTRVMFQLSAIFLHHWLFVVAGFVGLIVLSVIIVKQNRRRIIRLLLKLPVLRTLGKNIDFTRFCRSFGLLMHAGVPVVEALELSERVVQKEEIIQIVRAMKWNVESGKPLSSGLRKAQGVVPPLMTRSIETAEKSGTLEETMQNLTDYFDEQVNGSLKALGSLVEPALLVLVGLMVGGLMITIIAPIYNLISQINPKR